MKLRETITFSQRVPSTIQVVLTLTKATITLPVALTCLAGSLLADPNIGILHLFACASVWCMAAASSCINQIQERKLDAKMERTNSRPLSTKSIDIATVYLLTAMLILCSLVLLQPVFSTTTLLLLIGTLLWYNCVYTPLKCKTPWAVIAGAFIGASPPLLGYLMLWNQQIFSVQILWLTLFLFIGQLPHFWFLLLLYNSDYKRAGFAVLTDYLNKLQIQRITFAWCLLAFGTAFVLCGETLQFQPKLIVWEQIGVFLLFLLYCFFLFRSNLRKQFMTLNILYLLFLVFLISDRLFN